MMPAIPGGSGLFSILQAAITSIAGAHVRIDRHIWAQLDDFESLVHSLATRPTHLAELIPTVSSALGSCNAAKPGMGGIWFQPVALPLLWRAPFPTHIQKDLISDTNPHGTITNSELELAGILMHQFVLADHAAVNLATISVVNDNVAAVSWMCHGSATSKDACAYLLHLASLHQWQHRFLATHDYIAGPANAMADDASHHWDLSDTALLAHVQTNYPQSQNWMLVCLTPKQLSLLTSTLHSRPARPLSPPKAASQDSTWHIWCDFCFCSSLAIDPLLDSVDSPIPYLQVFAQRYRVGSISKSGQPIRTRSVEDALRSVEDALRTIGHDGPAGVHRQMPPEPQTGCPPASDPALGLCQD